MDFPRININVPPPPYGGAARVHVNNAPQHHDIFIELGEVGGANPPANVVEARALPAPVPRNRHAVSGSALAACAVTLAGTGAYTVARNSGLAPLGAFYLTAGALGLAAASISFFKASAPATGRPHGRALAAPVCATMFAVSASCFAGAAGSFFAGGVNQAQSAPQEVYASNVTGGVEVGAAAAMFLASAAWNVAGTLRAKREDAEAAAARAWPW